MRSSIVTKTSTNTAYTIIVTASARMKTDSRLKIGFVLDDSLDKADGVQQYVLAMGGWLSGQGHDVHYLVSTTTRNDVANVHSLGKNIAVRFNGNRMSM